MPEGGREEKSRSRGREGRGVRKGGEGRRREEGREGRGKRGEEGGRRREGKDTIRACLVWFASDHGRNAHDWFCGQGILCRQRMYPSVVVT